MELPKPPPHIARAGLRALKSVAAADGEMRAVELQLIGVIQRNILNIDDDLDELDTITPEQLAEAVTEELVRKRIVGACAMLSLVDADADASERTLVTAYAKALGVKDKTLKVLKRYAKGQMRLLRFDVARRFLAADRLKKQVRDGGFLSLFGVLRDALRRGEDTKLANRYRALGDLPDNTLGKQYFEFIRGNEFSLPGEVGAAPELIVFHDCHHVLAGYGTDPDDEAQIAAFHAGSHGEDPFGMLLFSMMQFHLGVQITPAAEAFEGRADPELLMRAFIRGSKVKGDVIRDWEPRDHFERDVDELRAELNILPRD